MNAAGIDISSRKSTVAVLRPFGEVVEVPFDVQHNAEALTALAEQLKSIDGETRVVMEHTGRYYESVAKKMCIRDRPWPLPGFITRPSQRAWWSSVYRAAYDGGNCP